MLKFGINLKLVAVTVTFTLSIPFINTQIYGWHENLEIDANKAAELYIKQILPTQI